MMLKLKKNVGGMKNLLITTKTSTRYVVNKTLKRCGVDTITHFITI